jgi:trehalose synthase
VDEIAIAGLPPDLFDEVVGPDRARDFVSVLARARERQGGHTLWHINSAAQGGGVAEMLQSILSYVVGAGIACRWLVIDGSGDFFELTKRIHHLLHAEPRDGPRLDERARQTYEEALVADADRIADLIRPGDVVILNDPQTLGVAPRLRAAGAKLIFTCHIGADSPDEHTRAAWSFLSPYVDVTDRQVFSRPQYVWEGLDPATVAVIPPCLDAFSPKNQELAPEAATAILAAAGIVSDQVRGSPPEFVRQDRTTGTVTTRAEMIQLGPIPVDAPVVTQVSRWDPLKDPAGVMAGFVQHGPIETGAHLALVGPAPESVPDDPDSQQVLDQLRDDWQRLPDAHRARVHLACLPMDDPEQNAAMVNAVQRRSDVVVQKSLAEGFGLTVAEAMWKRRPTVGSRVGGIQDQIEHGRSGVLLEDPTSAAELGSAVARLLADGATRQRMGTAARERVVERYLAPEHLTRYFELIGSLQD